MHACQDIADVKLVNLITVEPHLSWNKIEKSCIELRFVFRLHIDAWHWWPSNLHNNKVQDYFYEILKSHQYINNILEVMNISCEIKLVYFPKFFNTLVNDDWYVGLNCFYFNIILIDILCIHTGIRWEFNEWNGVSLSNLMPDPPCQNVFTYIKAVSSRWWRNSYILYNYSLWMTYSHEGCKPRLIFCF